MDRRGLPSPPQLDEGPSVLDKETEFFDKFRQRMQELSAVRQNRPRVSESELRTNPRVTQQNDARVTQQNDARKLAAAFRAFATGESPDVSVAQIQRAIEVIQSQHRTAAAALDQMAAQHSFSPFPSPERSSPPQPQPSWVDPASRPPRDTMGPGVLAAPTHYPSIPGMSPEEAYRYAYARWWWWSAYQQFCAAQQRSDQGTNPNGSAANPWRWT